MKKALLLLLGLLLVTSMFADFTWMQLNLYEGVGVANSFGDTYDLTYFELEGGGRTGILNLYYFVDINDILGLRDEDVRDEVAPGSYFMKINPRFSLASFVPEMGPIKETYLATQYKGWNGGDDYYVGLGTDLAVPFFERFSLNFYKMFEHINGTDTDGDFINDSFEDDFEDAGWVVAINWFTKLKTFNEKFNLSYQGWSDFGFANTFKEDLEMFGGTATEFQMFNGLFWNYEKWSISTSVKFHNNFIYFDTENHDGTSIFIGAHRRF